MQIRDLAIASGATAQTIRFYERRGLLDPAERAGNGYRRYNDAALSRLQFIRPVGHIQYLCGVSRP